MKLLGSAAACALLAALPANGQGTAEQYIAAGLFETGLAAQMPENADCPAITLGFGSRLNRSGAMRTEAHGAVHAGVDWALPEGTPIVAIADGRVVDKGDSPEDTRGNFVAIDHYSIRGGISSSYVHLSGFNVEKNQEVRQGQVIGYVGKTGKGATFVHLHLNVYGKQSVQVGDRKWRYRYDYLQFLSGDLSPIDPVLKRNQKVKVAYIDQHGKVHPPDAKVIWPFVCTTKAGR